MAKINRLSLFLGYYLYIIFSLILFMKINSINSLLIIFLPAVAYIGYDWCFKCDKKKIKISKIDIVLSFFCIIAIIWLMYNVICNFNKNSLYCSVKVICTMLIVICSCLVAYGKIIKNWGLENVFWIYLSTFGLIMLFVLPMRIVPDENTHIFSAYRVSEILLGNCKKTDDTFRMRKTDSIMFDEPIEWSYSNEMIDRYYEKSKDLTPNIEYTDLLPVASTVSKNDIAYILPGLGITFGKLLKLNGFYTLLLGRLMNYLMYSIVGYFSVKLIPNSKSIPALILSLPIAVQQGISYSYDSIVISLSIFIVCASLRLYEFHEQNDEIEWRISILDIIATIMLATLKSHAYIFVALFPLFLLLETKFPIEKYANRIISIILISIIVFIGISLLINFVCTVDIVDIPANPIAWDNNSQGYTLQYFINRPLDLVLIFIRTFFSEIVFYWKSSISTYMGWLNIYTSNACVYGYTLLLIASCTLSSKICFRKRCLQFYYVSASILTILGVMMGLLFGWTPVTSNVILGIQGRYFLPIYIFLLLFVSSLKIFPNIIEDRVLVLLDFIVSIFFFSSLFTVL